MIKGRSDRRIALVLFTLLLVVYNLNGREIGSYDSQPSKFAARELLLRGTLHLDEVVRQTPEYAQRWGFIHAADGHYRSVYSPVPPLIAAGVTWPLAAAGVIDPRAPLAPGLIAKLTASVLVSLAVVLSFFAARQQLAPFASVVLALGLGLGTGYWSTVSQTLWQTETAVFGLSLAVLAFTRPGERIGLRDALLVGAGLALAGATRPQLAPLVAVLLIGTWVRSRARHAAAASFIVGISAAAMAITNVRWFGHALGPQALLQDVNAAIHATGPTFAFNPEGLAGLLISPSRGILVFSPIVLIALVAMPRTLTQGVRSALVWLTLAFGAQFLLYGSFAVWWGGHTFGPRYMLDLLPLTVPLAAAQMAFSARRSLLLGFGVAALTWSIVVAATGAFSYPHERWNTDPTGIDRDHARLWDVRDSQIPRCWKRGLSPQNFRLIDPAALRSPLE